MINNFLYHRADFRVLIIRIESICRLLLHQTTFTIYSNANKWMSHSFEWLTHKKSESFALCIYYISNVLISFFIIQHSLIFNFYSFFLIILLIFYSHPANITQLTYTVLILIKGKMYTANQKDSWSKFDWFIKFLDFFHYESMRKVKIFQERYLIWFIEFKSDVHREETTHYFLAGIPIPSSCFNAKYVIKSKLGIFP